MSTRTAKQIVYGAFYAIIWVGIFFLVYSSVSKPAPSCFDGIKNQNEEGVDCGGVCALACGAASAKSITAGPVSVFTTTPGHYTFLVQITNTNANLAAKSFDYRLNLVSASGTVIMSIPGQSFIYANEVKYIVVPNQPLPQAPDHAEFAVMDPQWATDLGVVPDLNFQNVTDHASGATVSVGGQITNADTDSFESVLIVGVFKDAYGNVVGASETEVDGLGPNTTQSFSVIYPANPQIMLSSTQLFAYALRP